jgi:hypothetical protein
VVYGSILIHHESTERSTTPCPDVTDNWLSRSSTGCGRTTDGWQRGTGVLRPLREREADSREGVLAL